MSFTEINVTVQLRCSLGEVDEAREGGNEYYIRDVVDFSMLTNNWTSILSLMMASRTIGMCASSALHSELGRNPWW